MEVVDKFDELLPPPILKWDWKIIALCRLQRRKEKFDKLYEMWRNNSGY